MCAFMLSFHGTQALGCRATKKRARTAYIAFVDVLVPEHRPGAIAQRASRGRNDASGYAGTSSASRGA